MSDSDYRLIEEAEMEALVGQRVEIIGIGLDAVAMKTESGMVFIATMCLGCGVHVGYYEIDESMLESADDLSKAS